MFSPVPLLPLLAQEEDRSQAIGARAAELEEKAERVRVSAAKRGAQLDRWAGSQKHVLKFWAVGFTPRYRYLILLGRQTWAAQNRGNLWLRIPPPHCCLHQGGDARAGSLRRRAADAAQGRS